MSVPAERLPDRAPVLTFGSIGGNDPTSFGDRFPFSIVGDVHAAVHAIPRTLPPENDEKTFRRAPPLQPVGNVVDAGSKPRPVVLRALPTTQTSVLQVRQQWEGTVESVAEDEIVATLRDMTSPTNADERAVISRDEIPDADQSLVKLGAVFYWAIGYERTVFGQKSSKSSIRFRRLPAWTRSEVAAVRRDSDEMARALGLIR